MFFSPSFYVVREVDFFFHKLEAMEAEEAAEAAEIPAGGSEAGQNVFPLSPQRWVSHGRLVWNQYASMNTWDLYGFILRYFDPLD